MLKQINTMDKLLILPDIHGRTFWEKPCSDIDKYDKIVFLGDYLDPYDFEGITVPEAIDNFKKIIEFKKNNLTKVVLLLGNHDCPYYSIDYYKLSSYHCRHSIKYHDDISKLFQDNKDLFKLAYAYGDILFTHAGVDPTWYTEACDIYALLNDSIDDICYKINKLKENVNPLFMVSYTRGGDEPYASCVWRDVSEMVYHKKLINDGDEYKTPFEDIKQVFGHTLQAFYNHDGDIVYGDAIEGDNFKMLDNTKAYELDTKTFKIKAI